MGAILTFHPDILSDGIKPVVLLRVNDCHFHIEILLLPDGIFYRHLAVFSLHFQGKRRPSINLLLRIPDPGHRIKPISEYCRRAGSQNSQCHQGDQGQTKLLQAPLLALFHGFHRQVHSFGDLPAGQAVVILHPNHAAVLLFQFPKGLLQRLPVQNRVFAAVRRGLLQHFQRNHALLPILCRHPDGFSLGNHIEICFDRPLFRPEPLPVSVKIRKGLLYALPDIFRIRQIQAAGAPQKAHILFHQKTHAFFRILIQQVQKFFVGHRGSSSRTIFPFTYSCGKYVFWGHFS